MNQPPEKQSWTTVLYYTPRRGHLITSVCLRVGLYLCSVVSYGPKEEMLVLSSYVQARWIQVALHLLGSWLLTAYILLSYDRFLSTLKHFRPSDVVSVRNNNGFWWGSVSKAIAGLLGSPLYLALELHFWYYYQDFLINVKHKKEKSGQSAICFWEPPPSTASAADQGGLSSSIAVTLQNGQSRSCSPFPSTHNYHWSLVWIAECNATNASQERPVWAFLPSCSHMKNYHASSLSTAAGFSLSLPVSAFWTRFDCGQITCCMTLLCSSVIEHSLTLVAFGGVINSLLVSSLGIWWQ